MRAPELARLAGGDGEDEVCAFAVAEGADRGDDAGVHGAAVYAEGGQCVARLGATPCGQTGLRRER